MDTTHEAIMQLERMFWQAVVDMDLDTAGALLDERSVSVGPWGIHHFSPAEYQAMAAAGNARLTGFEFFDAQVVFPATDLAVATYRARQAFTMAGEHQEMEVYDTTTWVRRDGRWRACAHTETPAEGDPEAVVVVQE